MKKTPNFFQWLRSASYATLPTTFFPASLFQTREPGEFREVATLFLSFRVCGFVWADESSLGAARHHKQYENRSFHIR